MGPLVHLSIGPLVRWSIGPLDYWSIGPLVECQMLNVNKVKLLSERTSGVPPVIIPFVEDYVNTAQVKVRCLMLLFRFTSLSSLMKGSSG